MNTSSLPSLRCQAHWQNAQSNCLNQILPKSFPARPALTHGLNDIAANLTRQYFEQKNGLIGNTMQEFSGRVMQFDAFNKGQTFQRFDTNCKQLPAKSCIEPLPTIIKNDF